jgi:hypothetical protein
VVSNAGREHGSVAIGDCKGEDDDDPNVATRDRRAPPQGSTAPWWWGTTVGGRGVRAVAMHLHGCTVVGRAAWLHGCRVLYVLLSP